MQVTAFNIKYKDNRSYLTITGCDALKAFAEQGRLNMYNASSAPTTLEIEIDVPDNFDILTSDFNEAYDKAKKVLEEETGLEIINFGLKF